VNDIRDHLLSIYRDHGYLTGALVVEVAADETHPLHNHLDWDDASAAHAHRVDQAKGLIRKARIRYTEPTETDPAKHIRAFVSVTTREGRPTYVPTEEVVEDDFMRTLALRTMEHDWKALVRRYQTFTEFWELVRGDAEAA
jgi:hypothetical protein